MIKGWTLFLACTFLGFGLILTGCPKQEASEEMAPEPAVEAPAEVEKEAEMTEMEKESVAPAEGEEEAPEKEAETTEMEKESVAPAEGEEEAPEKEAEKTE